MVNFACPGYLGDLAVFRRVYQLPIEAGRDKHASTEAARLAASRMAALSQLLSSIVLRRSSEVVNKYLPPKCVSFYQPGLSPVIFFYRACLTVFTSFKLFVISVLHLQPSSLSFVVCDPCN
jgi:hypothetical protein